MTMVRFNIFIDNKYVGYIATTKKHFIELVDISNSIDNGIDAYIRINTNLWNTNFTYTIDFTYEKKEALNKNKKDRKMKKK